ncbi:hypothetical protein EDB89DRAFT_1901986 [Lactarius sanguifluus]|nr:hypothetical protein EDB89DRAFT_1901986 [Lactarius sanguifluus]
MWGNGIGVNSMKCCSLSHHNGLILIYFEFAGVPSAVNWQWGARGRQVQTYDHERVNGWGSSGTGGVGVGYGATGLAVDQNQNSFFFSHSGLALWRVETAIDEGIEKGATIGKPEDELGVIGRRVGAEAPSRPGSEDLPHKAFSTSTFFGAVVLAVFSAVERASGAMTAKLAAPPPTTPATSGLGFPPRPRIRPRPLDAVHYHHATTTKIEPGSVQQQKQRSMTAAMTNPTITMTTTTTTTTTPATTITTTTTTATTRRLLQGGQNDDDGDEATATTTMTMTSTLTHTTTSTKTKTKDNGCGDNDNNGGWGSGGNVGTLSLRTSFTTRIEMATRFCSLGKV